MEKKRKILIKKKLSSAKYFRVLIAALQKRTGDALGPLLPGLGYGGTSPARAGSSPHWGRGSTSWFRLLTVPRTLSSHKGWVRDPGLRVCAAVLQASTPARCATVKSASGARLWNLRSAAMEARRLLADQASWGLIGIVCLLKKMSGGLWPPRDDYSYMMTENGLQRNSLLVNRPTGVETPNDQI